MPRTVVVIGGGVSGLAVAYELRQRAGRVPEGLNVVCLESADRPGGNIRSSREAGFLCEWGPTGFLDNAPATLELVRRLGLEDRLVQASSEAEVRFIFRKGKLRRVPMTPLAFLVSDILSPGGKLRLLGEPFAARCAEGVDESVFDFAARRIGREAASVLVDAMVSGVYAGDARRLSLGATFPKMRRMEADHGSLVRAMLARRKEARASGTKSGGPAGPGGRLTSFKEGLQELIDALAGALGSGLELRRPIRAVSFLGQRGFRIHPVEGPPFDASAVVLSTPAWKAAEIVGTMDEPMAEALQSIPSAPVAVVHLGFSTAALGDYPEGFGFLVPRRQGPRILGALWITSIFPGRAADGRRLFTLMIGGAHEPGAVELGDESLLEIARNDLRETMGIVARPYFTRIIRWPRGIPQYTLGHLDRVSRIEQRLRAYPGLWVSGNSYHGISVNLCVEEAPRVATEICDFLA